MKFNAKKCYILSIRQKSTHFYELDKTILQQVEANPYLGLTISENLTWDTHIKNISKKANSTLGFLKRNLRNCQLECRKLAYIALVRSSLEYGAVVWDPYRSRDITTLEKIQRKAVRFICRDYKSREDGCVTDMMHRLELDTLQSRRKDARLVLLHKITRGTVPAIDPKSHLTPIRNKRQIKPTKFTDSISNNPIEKFQTNHSDCYTIKPAKTEQYKQSFFIKAVQDWNSLDHRVASAKTVESFKTALTHRD